MFEESVWTLTAGQQNKFPQLKGELSADVVIVGGGITGLTCAYQLARSGKKVVVVEGEKIGHSTTGKSTGNLYSVVDYHLTDLSKTWGEEITKQVVLSRKQAIESIYKTCSDLGIECHFTRCSFNYFTEEGSKSAFDFFKSESEAARAAGLSVKIHDSTTKPFLTKGALEILNQSQFHPYKYVTGLARRISDRILIFENSKITDFDLKNKILTSAEGKIHFSKLVFATHVPKGVWTVQMKLAPIREHGMAAPLIGQPFAGSFWRYDSPKRSVRTISAGGRNYVIVIGDKFKTGQNPDTQHENEILSHYLQTHFEITDERFWWGAQSYRSADKLPFIGQLQEDIFALTGFSTDGLVYGTLGAQIVADHILGIQNRWAEIYDMNRSSLLKSAGTMAKEGYDNFCQYAKDLPGVGTASPDELVPGEGKIITHNGEKLAVYCDDAGKKHAVSAVCTHMKCIVSFNNAERTWDCPCHASRFNTDGTVIEGPAVYPLERKSYEEPQIIDRTVRGRGLSGNLPRK